MIGLFMNVSVDLEQTEREHASVAAIIRQLDFPQGRYFPIGVYVSEIYKIQLHTNTTTIEENAVVW